VPEGSYSGNSPAASRSIPWKRASRRPTVRRSPRRSDFWNRPGRSGDSTRGETTRQPGVALELRGDGRTCRGVDLAPLLERPRVVPEGELAHFGQEGREVGGLRVEFLVKPGRRRHRGQIELVRAIVREGRPVEVVPGVQVGGDEDRSVEGHSLALEVREQRGAAGRAVRLAHQELRRVPTVVGAHPALEELAERLDVLVGSVEVLRLPFPDDAGEPGPDGVHEDEIRPVEQGVGVLDETIRGRRRIAGVERLDAQRRERSHVQPDARRAGTPVERKGHGTRLRVGALRRVRDVEHPRDRFVLRILEIDRRGGRRIGERLAPERDSAMNDRGRRGRPRRGRGCRLLPGSGRGLRFGLRLLRRLRQG
jgi:hypothetical protein